MVAAAENLTVWYGSRAALRELSLEVPSGSVGLLGPNGAGKTTLLKTWLGFLRPGAGTATVLGLDAGREGLAIRQRVGLMPEMDCHIPGMTGVAYVAYAGELCGMPSAEALRRAHEVLEYCGLGEARYRQVDTYSTGMRQRVKLAQALVHGPRLLFLDEPTNGLDPEGRREMLRLIREISAAKGVNVIVSSHLLPDIEETCDYVLVLREGQLAARGAISELRRTTGVQVDVELREPSQAFLHEIEQLGGAVLTSEGSRCRLRLPENTSDPVRAVLRAAVASGAQVRGIRPATRSLEDVFVEAML